MAKRWLQSVDLEIDEQGRPVFEAALTALADLIDDGRLKVAAAGPPDGFEIGWTAIVAGPGNPKIIVPATPGKICGLLQLMVTVVNDESNITLTDTDNGHLFEFVQIARGSGPFIDPPAPYTPFVEAPAGKGIRIDATPGAVIGMAVWMKRSVPE